MASITLPVIGSVTVLLQEVIFDQFGYFQGDFIRLRQRRLLRVTDLKQTHRKHLTVCEAFDQIPSE